MASKSLRAELLIWLMAPLATVALLDAWLTYERAISTATLVQERLLLGSARMIAEQIHFSDGAFEVTIPPAALELFVAEKPDRVFYRVSASDGRLLSGYFEMETPAQLPSPEHWSFFDTELRNERVYAVVFSQPVLEPGASGPVSIQVGQTLANRHALAREVWQHAVREQMLMLALVALLVGMGLRRGLAPVMALRDAMSKRRPETLTPVDERPVPSELRPLVNAMNEYIGRLTRHMMARSRFIADASHQLRTPLTVLNTQVSYALRSKDAKLKDEALLGMRKGVRNGIRLVNQLLAYTEVESDIGMQPQLGAVDICEVSRSVLEELALLAQENRIDLGFETSSPKLWAPGTTHLLHNLIANLVDNALRYVPAGGEATVRLEPGANGGVILQVEDNGPGIAEADRERAFERFCRLQSDDIDGCGLGLAIVREIATSCGATVKLATPGSGRGLLAIVAFPPIRPSDPHR